MSTVSNRNLSTSRTQVFGDIEPGTKCRVCGRIVTDGRSKTCSDYCDNVLTAVMGMLNWSTVRYRVIERDDETCQECGYDHAQDQLAREHIRAIIKEKAGERPDGPSMLAVGEGEEFDWDEHRDRMDAWTERRDNLRERYGDPYADFTRTLEVDHITPVADGGHPFDPGNLQTLCDECHQEKTSRENSERSQRRTPSAAELNESLFNYVADGGER